jgi:MEDS: MEthanogen/methylotroph, DcmR Sensory domain
MGEHQKNAVRLAGMELEPSCHACAFFHNRDEEYRVLLPFAQEGFERGDKGFHIVDPRHREERLRRLEQLGIDLRQAERTGQIEVRAWENAHLRQGHFDQYAMLALVEEVLTGGKAGGFGTTRFWANMEWGWRIIQGCMTSWSMRRDSTISSRSTTMSWCARTT